MREKPDELNRAFISPFNQTDFLWTGELFVAREPLYRIPKRPGGERGDFNRVVMLDTLLRPHLQAKARIVAGFRNPAVKREELLGAHQNLLLVEQPHRQTSLPQHHLGRKAKFFELPWQRGRDSKLVCHRSPNSINLKTFSGITCRMHNLPYSRRPLNVLVRTFLEDILHDR